MFVYVDIFTYTKEKVIMNGHVRRKIGNKWQYVIEMSKIGGKRQRIQKDGWDTKTEAQEHLREVINEYK